MSQRSQRDGNVQVVKCHLVTQIPLAAVPLQYVVNVVCSTKAIETLRNSSKISLLSISKAQYDMS